MLKIIRLSDKSTLITIKANINEIVGGGLESNLPKSKKTKITKSKILAKSKNLTVGAMRFLTFKARVIFI